jgi:magnesium-transporting ATPase (P-type)
MAFTRMNIGDKLYGNDKMALDKLDLNDNYGKITNFQFEDDDFYEHLNNPEHDNYYNIQMFLSCLSLCHTVYTQFDKGKLIFNSSSPDEMALINAARKFGYIFRERRVNNEVILEINGKPKVYTILDIIEYTLER